MQGGWGGGHKLDSFCRESRTTFPLALSFLFRPACYKSCCAGLQAIPCLH